MQFIFKKDHVTTELDRELMRDAIKLKIMQLKKDATTYGLRSDGTIDDIRRVAANLSAIAKQIEHLENVLERSTPSFNAVDIPF